MARVHLIIMPQYRSSDLRLSPPLGIACLAAYLKKYDVDVTCTDFRTILTSVPFISDYNYRSTDYVAEIPDLALCLYLIKNYKEGKPLMHGLDNVISNCEKSKNINYKLLLGKISNIYNIIHKEAERIAQYDILGFTTVHSNFFLTLLMSLLVRRINPNINIIYGGPQTTLSINSAKIILKLGIANVVVMGEGEDVLLRLVRNFKNDEISQAGTATYDKISDKFLLKSNKVPLNLNNLPDPDFSIFDFKNYAPLELPLYSSRGCIFKCRFCSYNKQFIPYRIKDPMGVINTMERLNKKYKTIRFNFVDNALNFSESWLDKFAEELISRKYNFQWSGLFSPNIKISLIEKLKKSGLYKVAIGVESFSPQVLKSMGKAAIDLKHISKAIDSFCSADIKVVLAIIVGLPGESKADFRYTIARLSEFKKKYPKNFVVGPQKFQLRIGSDCFEEHSKYSIEIKKWPNGIKMMIKEIDSLVERIPMTFSSRQPTNRERNERLKYLLTNTLATREDKASECSEQDKKFLGKCLTNLKGYYKIKVYAKGFKEIRIITKRKYVLKTWLINGVLFTEKEKIIIAKLNESSSISEISNELCMNYGYTRKYSYRYISHLLRYLLDNNIKFIIYS